MSIASERGGVAKVGGPAGITGRRQAGPVVVGGCTCFTAATACLLLQPHHMKSSSPSPAKGWQVGRAAE